VTRLDPPRERECERCGRQDVWDADVREWRIVETGEPTAFFETPETERGERFLSKLL